MVSSGWILYDVLPSKQRNLVLLFSPKENNSAKFYCDSYVLDLYVVTGMIQEVINKPKLNVTHNQVTNEKAIIDVTPAWFEPIKPSPPQQIQFPTYYDKSSDNDVRTYNCLPTYRSMIKETSKIDFHAEPFTPTVKNQETAVVVLNEVVHKLGARLTFTHNNFTYNDSDYRTACGVSNLGSIYSFLDSEGKFQTATFALHLNLDYNDIKRSPESLRKFVLAVIIDIHAIAECDKDFIRVFSVTGASSAFVKVGITVPNIIETRKVAESLKDRLNKIRLARPPNISDNASTLQSQVLSEQRSDILQYLIREDYDYKLEPALAYLQLQPSDFEPSYNRNYPDAREEIRVGYPYHFPQGWYRHALKVENKYPDGRAWLGMINGPGEWAVAYHGTNPDALKNIKDQGLLHKIVARDLRKSEA